MNEETILKAQIVCLSFLNKPQYKLLQATNLDDYKNRFRNVVKLSNEGNLIEQFIAFSEDLKSSLLEEGRNSGQNNLLQQYLSCLKDFTQNKPKNIQDSKLFGFLCKNPNILNFLEKNLIRFEEVSLNIAWAADEATIKKSSELTSSTLPSGTILPRRKRSESFHEDLGNVPQDVIDASKRLSLDVGRQ